MTGLILGRFIPLHLGHCFLIDMAKHMCDHVHIIVCSHTSDSIDGITRYDWVRSQYPQCVVHHMDKEIEHAHSGNPQAPQIWAEEIRNILENENIDYVFTSESYGLGFAKHLHATWIPVDLQRTVVPVSGEKIRANYFAHWQYLAPVVQASVSKVIAVRGDSRQVQDLAGVLEALYNHSYASKIRHAILDQGLDIDDAQFLKNAHAKITTLRHQGKPLVITQFEHDYQNNTREHQLTVQEIALYDQHFQLQNSSDIQIIIDWWNAIIHPSAKF